MPPKLKGRSFISTLEFKPAELEFLLDRAAALKKSRGKDGKKGRRPLEGKSVAMVFFNPSASPSWAGRRSRCRWAASPGPSSTARAR